MRDPYKSMKTRCMSEAAIALELEIAHRMPIGKDSTPASYFISIMGGLLFCVNRVNRGIISHSLHTPIRGWSLSGNTLFLCSKRMQIHRFCTTLFQIGEDVVKPASQCPVIASGTRRIDHQQDNTRKCGQGNEHHGPNWQKIGHRRNSTSSKKYLHSSQQARETCQSLLTYSVIGNLLTQPEPKVVPFYFVRRGGGGGGAKFVSDRTPPLPGEGTGLGCGGGGGDFPLFDDCNVDDSILIVPLCLLHKGMRGAGSHVTASRHRQITLNSLNHNGRRRLINNEKLQSAIINKNNKPNVMEGSAHA